MSKVTYLIHLELSKKGNFIVTVPKLPGCRTTAGTFEQALDEAKTAIERHIKALTQAGKSVPVESRRNPPLCMQIRVEVPKLKGRTGWA